MTTVPPRPPLVGRADTLGLLAEALDRCRDGAGGVLVLEGDPGTGKTRLLDEATDLASDRGLAVARGGGDEVERARPFGPFVQAFGLERDADDPDRAALGRFLTGDIGQVSPPVLATIPELQFRVLDGIVALVDRVCSDQPLLVALDDLQWADPSTCLVVGALARRIATRRAVVVVALRRAPRPAELASVLAGLDRPDHLQLEGLDAVRADELVRHLAGGDPGPGLRAAAARAGGNPFYLVELIRALAESGHLRRTGSTVEVGDITIPDSLQSMLRQRIERLPLGGREVVRLAAVLGSSFTATELAALRGVAPVEVVEALDEAIAAGVLQELGPEVGFRHDLVREVVYEAIPAASRLALHRDAGRALISEGADPLRVARHLALAARPGDTEAVAWLRRAAAATGPRSPEVAVGLLDRALDINDDPRDGLAIQIEQVEVLAWGGRLAESEELSRTVLPHVMDGAQRARLEHYLGASLLVQSRVGEAIEALERAAGDLPAGPDHVRVSVEVSLLQLLSGDQQAARTTATAAREQAEQLNDLPGIALARSVLSRLESFQLRLTEAVGHAEVAVDAAARDTAGDSHQYVPLFFHGLVLHDLDRLDEAADAVSDGRAAAASSGNAWALPLYDALAGFTAFRRGAIGDATAEAQAGLRSAEESGSRLAEVWSHSLIGLAALHSGDIDLARQASADAAVAFADTNALLGIDMRIVLEARIEQEDGQAGRALARLEEAWGLFGELGLGVSRQVVGLPLALAAVDMGEADLAVATAEGLDSIAEQAPIGAFRGAALLVRGILAGDLDVLAAAVDAYRSSPRALESVVACERAARVMADAGDRDGAVSLFEEARSVSDGCHARADTDRIEAELRRLAPRRTASTPRPKTGWESLTPSEERVVRLVAEGMSNAEIAERLCVSTRTVESHLYRVYPKLGLDSRLKLSVQAARRFQ